MVNVTVEGDFATPHGSLAIVNRGLFGALARRGNVELELRTEPSADAIAEDAGVWLEAARARAGGRRDVTVRHVWPPVPSPVRTGAYVHMQPWEFGSLPRSWVESLKGTADEIWCYSRYVANEYLEAGFAPERVHVVPLGIDPEVFFPKDGPRAIPSERSCVFLFFGGTITRKGIDVLLEAWRRAFTRHDDVALVIKDVKMYDAHDQRRQQILQLSSRPDFAEMLYADHVLSKAEVVDLYRSVSCLVHPYRGEGFGLTVLEAMACGLPVITTRGGATDDFVTPECGYLIESKRVPLMSPPPEPLIGDGWLLEPDVEQLAAAMRTVYGNREEARKRGTHAAKVAHAGWTWEHGAKRAERRIAALSADGSTARTRPGPRAPVASFEFKATSQNGEDGILVELFRQLGVREPFFVEFGAQAGVECNARNLVFAYGWAGVMMEGDDQQFLALQDNYRNITRVKTEHAFITKENALEVFERAGIPPEFDLLSIDIDGNDYWIWEALAEKYRPRVVVMEVNGSYAPPKRWVMAYNPSHAWRHDNYYGASLQSLADLGSRFGYGLVGMESAGVNAFFVRDDLVERCGFPALSAEQAYRPPRHIHRPGTGPFVEV